MFISRSKQSNKDGFQYAICFKRTQYAHSAGALSSAYYTRHGLLRPPQPSTYSLLFFHRLDVFVSASSGRDESARFIRDTDLVLAVPFLHRFRTQHLVKPVPDLISRNVNLV